MSPAQRGAGAGLAEFTPLFVIPCLNEAAHIRRLLDQFGAATRRLGGIVVIADGGSIDGTREMAEEAAARDPFLHFLDNPERIQSAGINRAVQAFGDRATHLIRIDAHCDYPEDFADTLLEDARATGAASVVVSMRAHGDAGVQRLNAVAQNAPLGNGGSPHRNPSKGANVTHGHHALIEIAAFREVGGYDPRFSHNEDAELDFRLSSAGHRIWLTNRTAVTYFPRQTYAALARQYFNYGRGRAQSLLKHRTRPQPRQLKAMGIAPALGLALFAPLHPVFALPALAWIAICATLGLRLSLSARSPALFLTVVSAVVMHVAWSLGFWMRIISPTPAQPLGVAQ